MGKRSSFLGGFLRSMKSRRKWYFFVFKMDSRITSVSSLVSAFPRKRITSENSLSLKSLKIGDVEMVRNNIKLKENISLFYSSLLDLTNV